MKQQHLTGTVCAWAFATTLFAVGVAPAPVQAASELFPSTEVTVRYEPIEWLKARFFSSRKSESATAEPVAFTPTVSLFPITASTMTENPLDAIEPAAGGGGGHGGSDNAESKGEGKSEGKSFNGKQLTAPPPLPNVTIGGRAVVSYADSVAKDISETTPEGLKDSGMAMFLTRRFNVTPYAHSPSRGPRDAKVKVLEFVDLSCGLCMPELAKIDIALQPYASSTLVTSIHAPTARFQDTNMQAFYGKIAARGGVFWAYRKNLIEHTPQDANAIFDELIKSGMGLTDTRALMLTDARRFYREMDADALLARSFGVGKPPILFVNGIRVGDGGVPLDKLSDVMQYVHDRLKRGLSEPPQ